MNAVTLTALFLTSCSVVILSYKRTCVCERRKNDEKESELQRSVPGRTEGRNQLMNRCQYSGIGIPRKRHAFVPTAPTTVGLLDQWHSLHLYLQVYFVRSAP